MVKYDDVLKIETEIPLHFTAVFFFFQRPPNNEVPYLQRQSMSIRMFSEENQRAFKKDYMQLYLFSSIESASQRTIMDQMLSKIIVDWTLISRIRNFLL